MSSTLLLRSQKSLVTVLTESSETSRYFPGGVGAQLATVGLLGVLDGVVLDGVGGGGAGGDVEGGAGVDVEDAVVVDEGLAVAEVDVEATVVVDEGELLAD